MEQACTIACVSCEFSITVTLCPELPWMRGKTGAIERELRRSWNSYAKTLEGDICT
jgi:hypothetical protein